ncbi:hypothetical protein M5K25_021291 [Dendrobium thyrsiflorum]|uniref:Protein kish n=1 Tax=Dendrobium thyrsiflorum TaxID=117978 RepID=A0ABD0UCP6_DENTH
MKLVWLVSRYCIDRSSGSLFWPTKVRKGRNLRRPSAALPPHRTPSTSCSSSSLPFGKAYCKSALFNFHSFLTVVLLVICTCTYIKMQFPAVLEQRTGFRGFFWKAARIGFGNCNLGAVTKVSILLQSFFFLYVQLYMLSQMQTQTSSTKIVSASVLGLLWDASLWVFP